MVRLLLRCALLSLCSVAAFPRAIAQAAAPASQSATPLTPQQVLERAKAATVVVLVGEGGGRLHGIGTGAVISRDGVILTAFHVVRGAAEVQVRLPSGEVYDRVQLVGTDERRDVAALKIAASGLAFLQPGDTSSLKPGDPVYAVTNANGLSWSAMSGIFSALRPADEVPGAGSGFRMVQFTAPIAPGASGGALVDGDARLIGIVTGKMNGGAGFAVPAESVMGLPDLQHPQLLGSGVALQPPAKLAEAVPQSSAAIANADPKAILKNAKTIYLHSKTSFLTVDTLDRALLLQKQWKDLGLTIVAEERVADLVLEIDRPLFTYVHTWVMQDKRTSIILGSGKVTAFDGTTASGGLAKQIVGVLAEARLPAAGKH